MPYDLRPLVDRAIQRGVDPTSATFTSLSFAEVVKEDFALKQRPRGSWCAAVLFKLDYLITDDGGHTWRFKGKPKRPEPDCLGLSQHNRGQR